MTPARFRALALALPEAIESQHMGHPDFRVGKKIFATLRSDEKEGSIKCEPANLDALVRAHPGVLRDSWGGRWLGVALAQADDALVQPLLEDAWRMVAPKRMVREHE